MPYKTEKKKLNSQFMDKRVKLLDCQKEMVVYWTDQGMSQRNLSKMFGVSRRTIQFIQSPKKLEENKQRRAERGGSKAYYDKDKHKEYMKKHRRRKHEILNGIA